MTQEKNYALIYLYEGTESQSPFSIVMCVSNNLNKVKEQMKEWITHDTQIDEEDEYNEDCNFSIAQEYDNEVLLSHNKINLYTKYKIQSVEII